MKCSACNYENREDALVCNLCKAVLRREPHEATPAVHDTAPRAAVAEAPVEEERVDLAIRELGWMILLPMPRRPREVARLVRIGVERARFPESCPGCGQRASTKLDLTADWSPFDPAAARLALRVPFCRRCVNLIEQRRKTLLIRTGIVGALFLLSTAVHVAVAAVLLVELVRCGVLALRRGWLFGARIAGMVPATASEVSMWIDDRAYAEELAAINVSSSLPAAAPAAAASAAHADAAAHAKTKRAPAIETFAATARVPGELGGELELDDKTDPLGLIAKTEVDVETEDTHVPAPPPESVEDTHVPPPREEKPSTPPPREEKPQARDDKPLARDDKPLARDDKPLARDDKPLAREDKPLARDDKPSPSRAAAPPATPAPPAPSSRAAAPASASPSPPAPSRATVPASASPPPATIDPGRSRPDIRALAAEEGISGDPHDTFVDARALGAEELARAAAPKDPVIDRSGSTKPEAAAAPARSVLTGGSAANVPAISRERTASSARPASTSRAPSTSKAPGQTVDARVSWKCDEGDTLMREKRFVQALVKFEEALALLPAEDKSKLATRIHASIGEASFHLSDWTATKTHMTRALASPAGAGEAALLLRLGQALFELGDTRAAKETLTSAYKAGGSKILEGAPEKYRALVTTN